MTSNNTNTHFIYSPLSIPNGKVSVSSSTGALVVSGGAGIGGSVYLGSDLNVSGNIIMNNTKITGLGAPTLPSDCATKNYVDTKPFSGPVSITGSLSKGAGTFSIPHPLDSSKKLVHSFIEGPRCDNIYRGVAKLENGRAIVNLDNECTELPECGMSQGTFTALNTNCSYYLQNKDSFDNVIGKIEGNLLLIVCENENSTDTVNWMVIGERKDSYIKKWDLSNSKGNLITEW